MSQTQRKMWRAIRRRLAEEPYPQNIKDKVSEELARYEMLPAASGETGVIKTYIDWLMALPWWQETKDNEDLQAASRLSWMRIITGSRRSRSASWNIWPSSR